MSKNDYTRELTRQMDDCGEWIRMFMGMREKSKQPVMYDHLIEERIKKYNSIARELELAKHG